MYVALEGVHRVKKRLADGTVAIYAYAWRGGPRMLAKPGTPAFIAEWHEHNAARRQPPTGILFTLIAEYKAASEFKKLGEATRGSYLRYLKLIEDKWGTVPIRALGSPSLRGDIKKWRDGMSATPRAADLAWTVFARVLSVAKDNGRIPVNILLKGGRLYAADRNDAIWTDEMVATVRERFPAHLRWAFMLALYTGQRQGDLLALPWTGYQDGRIRLEQGKGKRRVSIPVAKTLREEIALIPKRGDLMLTTSFGEEWTSDGFSASWRKACIKAGIKGVTFHDIRGSSVTRLAEAGADVTEIATITGHSLRDVSAILDAHYLSRTDALADSAIRKLERKERSNARQNTGGNRQERAA